MTLIDDQNIVFKNEPFKFHVKTKNLSILLNLEKITYMIATFQHNI